MFFLFQRMIISRRIPTSHFIDLKQHLSNSLGKSNLESDYGFWNNTTHFVISFRNEYSWRRRKTEYTDTRRQEHKIDKIGTTKSLYNCWNIPTKFQLNPFNCLGKVILTRFGDIIFLLMWLTDLVSYRH